MSSGSPKSRLKYLEKEIFRDPAPGPPCGKSLGPVRYAQIRELLRCNVPRTHISWIFACGKTVINTAWADKSEETRERDATLLDETFKEFRNLLVAKNSPPKRSRSIAKKLNQEEVQVEDELEDDGTVDSSDEDNEMETTPSAQQEDGDPRTLPSSPGNPDLGALRQKRGRSTISIDFSDDDTPTKKRPKATQTQFMVQFLSSIDYRFVRFSPSFHKVGIKTQHDFEEFVKASAKGKDVLLAKAMEETKLQSALDPTFKPMTWLQSVQIGDALDKLFATLASA